MAYRRRYKSGHKRSSKKGTHKKSGSKTPNRKKSSAPKKIKWEEPRGYLIIVEKPSVAKKFKEVFGLKEVKRRGKVTYYSGEWKGKEITVMPLAGHVLEIKFPKEKFSVFPLMPDDIKFEPIRGKKAFLDAIMREAKDKWLVFATDWDREGELISYEVYNYLKVPEDRHFRMHFSALTKEDIINSFERAVKNGEKIDFNLAHAGLVRAYLDKLYGFNITRMVTKAVSDVEHGFELWSAGRVQTPTLRLILEREKEIEKHVALDTVKLRVHFEANGFTGVAESETVIIPTDKAVRAHGKDVEKKFGLLKETVKLLGAEMTVKETKNGVNVKVTGGGGEVPVEVIVKEVKEKPPAPLDTTRAINVISKSMRMKAPDVQRILQKLYEDARISYPRTDSTAFDKSKYPASYHKKILTLLENHYPEARGRVSNTPRVAGKKLDPAHPPIHPKGEPVGLSGVEAGVYSIIARHYIALFMPDFIKKVLTVEFKTPLKVTATYSKVIDPGWKVLFGYEDGNIPDLSGVKKVKILKVEAVTGKTKPPARYTTASIISKMEAVNIGTKSTRPNIIKTLEDRGYITVKNNTIHITQKGRRLVELFDSIDDEKVRKLSLVEFTAMLEEKMSKIERGIEDYERVIDEHKVIIGSLGDDDVEKVKKAYVKVKGK